MSLFTRNSRTLLLTALLMIWAQEVAWAQTWKVGTNVTATFKGGTLTISGKGDMYSYGDACESEAPAGAFPCKKIKDVTKVIVGNGVESCGGWLRMMSNVTDITIGSGMMSFDREIYPDGFSGGALYPRLTAINIDPKNTEYSSIDGVLFNKDQTILMLYPAGRVTRDYKIPNSVISIKENAFNDCKGLKSIIIKNPIPPKLTMDIKYKLDVEACTLYVPQGSAYDKTTGWNEFKYIGYMDSTDSVSQIVSAIGKSFAEDHNARKKAKRALEDIDTYKKQLAGCDGRKSNECGLAMYLLGLAYYTQAVSVRAITVDGVKPDYSMAIQTFQRLLNEYPTIMSRPSVESMLSTIEAELKKGQ